MRRVVTLAAVVVAVVGVAASPAAAAPAATAISPAGDDVRLGVAAGKAGHIDPNGTATFAPHGPIGVAGRWMNGSPSRIVWTNVKVPVRIVGSFVCLPSDYTATMSMTYVVRDASDSSADVVIS